MAYTVILSLQAKEDISKLKRNDPNCIKKISKLLIELQQHPRTGTGQVELLKHYKEETFSRRINRYHRIIYRINDDTVQVLVISAYGHYQD